MQNKKKQIISEFYVNEAKIGFLVKVVFYTRDIILE